MRRSGNSKESSSLFGFHHSAQKFSGWLDSHKGELQESTPDRGKLQWDEQISVESSKWKGKWNEKKGAPLMANWICSGGILSIHFWMTWLPFWSLMHLRMCPSSSLTRAICWSTSICSSAFWTTLHPYIWRDSGKTCPVIFVARMFLCCWVPAQQQNNKVKASQKKKIIQNKTQIKGGRSV